MKKLSRSQCPVAATIDAIRGKWKPLILFALRERPYRFGELLRKIDGATHKVLAQQLRQLEREEVVDRRVERNASLLKVEYSLSSHGAGLRPILNAMCDWGSLHQSRLKTRLRAVAAR